MQVYTFVCTQTIDSVLRFGYPPTHVRCPAPAPSAGAAPTPGNDDMAGRPVIEHKSLEMRDRELKENYQRLRQDANGGVNYLSRLLELHQQQRERDAMREPESPFKIIDGAISSINSVGKAVEAGMDAATSPETFKHTNKMKVEIGA